MMDLQRRQELECNRRLRVSWAPRQIRASATTKAILNGTRARQLISDDEDVSKTRITFIWTLTLGFSFIIRPPLRLLIGSNRFSGSSCFPS